MSSSYQYEHFDVSHIYLLTIFLKLYFSPPSFLTFFEKRAVKNSAQPYPWIFFTKIIVQHPKNPKTPRNLPPNSTVTGSGISTQLKIVSSQNSSEIQFHYDHLAKCHQVNSRYIRIDIIKK